MHRTILRILACITLGVGLVVTIQAGTSIVVNPYAPATEVRQCRNWIRIDTSYIGVSAQSFRGNDTVLIIQMKGASVDSTGKISSMHAAGRFERNVIQKRSADTLFMRYTLLASYDATNIVQVVQFKRYPTAAEMGVTDIATTYTLAAPPFDGRAGGVIAIHSVDTMRLWCNIVADGCGYRQNEGVCTNGRSPNAGSSMPTNGGGGGHGGSGGNGKIVGTTLARGGTAISYNLGVNWLFMGGGGGASASAEGASGGGIVIIDAPSVHGNGFDITARGANAATSTCGAGAGGALLVTALSISNLGKFSVAGGNSVSGGGGGGGVVRIGTLTPLNLSASSYSGGTASANPDGNGESGRLFYNVVVNQGTTMFTMPNVSVTFSIDVCPGTDVQLRGYGMTVQAWTVGSDTICLQCDSVLVRPQQSTRYTAHFSINGCADSAVTTVGVLPVPMLRMSDTLYTCAALPLTIAAPDGFSRYLWSTNDTTQTITVSTEGTYSVEVRNEFGCLSTDSVVVRFTPSRRIDLASEAPSVKQLPDAEPFAQSVGTILVQNLTDTTVHITNGVMQRGVEVSLPLHQFPIALAPYQTHDVEVVGSYGIPGSYADVATLSDECGTLDVPISFTVTETVWDTRCKVRITSSGEMQNLTPELVAGSIVDVLGRVVQWPMPSGIYLIRQGTTTTVVQMP